MSAAFFLVGVVFFMPETRWHRSKLELCMQIYYKCCMVANHHQLVFPDKIVKSSTSHAHGNMILPSSMVSETGRKVGSH